MVMQNNRPRTKWVSTIQNPPKINQMMFMIVERQPILELVSVILIPKGAKPTTANLKHCMPKGIPTIVRQSTNPPKIYWKKIKIPPKITQMILPIRFVSLFVFMSSY